MVDLNKTFYSDSLDSETTLRGYLQTLLLTLWREEQGFSGKRPFGNSGWQSTLETDLVNGGVLPGKVVDEYYSEADGDFNKTIEEAIRSL